MRFRLRVLGLVMLVVVAATGATAWLTARLVTDQLTAASVANERDIETVINTLTEYAKTHGTWEGVPDTVKAVSATTGQRIKLSTEIGEVIVDTDTLDGVTARRPTSRAYAVNPRPVLDIDDAQVLEAHKITLESIERYRFGILLAVCLTRAGSSAFITGYTNGIPRLAPAGAAVDEPPRTCLVSATSESSMQTEDISSVAACDKQRDKVTCLRAVFADRTSNIGPIPLQLELGAIGEPRSLVAWPILSIVAVVLLLTLAATFLLSRRVLRPVTLLTDATRELAHGQLARRIPLTGNDELTAMAYSFNRMADSLQRAEERQRRLIADVAHELRTPLANLRGYLEALKDGVVAPEPAVFASLHDEAVLQQRIVDDLQELALAEAGVLAYQWSSVEIGELLETCRVAHDATAESAGIRLAIDCPQSILVRADPDRLRQVIGNLLSNACKHTPSGGTVTMRAFSTTESAVIEIADTGTGIAEADLPHIFDRFWRSDTSRRRSTGGSGLGLAIARQLVLDHGGAITASSEPGAGTTVTISLPLNFLAVQR